MSADPATRVRYTARECGPSLPSTLIEPQAYSVPEGVYHRHSNHACRTPFCFNSYYTQKAIDFYQVSRIVCPQLEILPSLLG
jgi:hypothetical protein